MITITKTEHGYSAVRTKDKTMHTTKHTPFKCWLWPNHVIGKSYSGLLREEHNALVNSHAEALDALRGMVGLVQLIQAREPDLQSNHRFIEAMRVIAKAENPNAETVQSYPSGRWTEKGTV